MEGMPSNYYLMVMAIKYVFVYVCQMVSNYHMTVHYFSIYLLTYKNEVVCRKVWSSITPVCDTPLKQAKFYQV